MIFGLMPVEAVFFSQIGHHAHLVRRRVARNAADRLQADHGGDVTCLLVRDRVAINPEGEIGIGAIDSLARFAVDEAV